MNLFIDNQLVMIIYLILLSQDRILKIAVVGKSNAILLFVNDSTYEK